MRTVLLTLVVLGLGCGGSKSSTTPKQEIVTCAAVADSMVGMMMEGKDQESRAAEAADGFKTIIRTRCDEDSWTAEARQCLATMKTRADAERCSTMLSEEQQANLVRDQKEKFGAPKESDATSTGVAPPPGGPPPAERSAPKAPPKQGAGPKKPGDPCDGGE